ncbi:MAG: ATP-binding cassette domain-containing protein, partial [Actinomycetales bacterium]|nr:ATP-binding cassette domain-containing protein [Actinomycetales bacterium]
MDALLAEGVSVHYGPRVAVSEMTLRVPQGRVVGLLGPNGAGKTSLIEGCLGLRPLASGRVWVQDVALPDALRRGWVGVMLQQGGVPGNVTATAWLRHIGRLFALEASVP